MAIEESHHHQLQDHMDSQQWGLARDVAYEMLEERPESSWLHATLGKIFYNLTDYNHAEAHLKHAIYHHENHVEAHAYLGQVYLKMKRMGSADDCCKKALSLDASSIQIWTLSFQLKLAYKDLDGAKECYSTLESLGADDGLLRQLRFNLLRHPANKKPIDYVEEVKNCKNHLAAFPEYFVTHAQLAYLYNRFTKESELAEIHIKKALEHNPHDPFFQETSMLIQRKQDLRLRILTAPAQALTRPEQISKNEIAAVGVVSLFLIMFAIMGQKHPWMIRAGVIGLLVMYFCSYTGNLAFQYLAYTERFHQLGKTSLLKEPHRKIHCMPFQKRLLIIGILTILAWIILGAFIYLLTR